MVGASGRRSVIVPGDARWLAGREFGTAAGAASGPQNVARTRRVPAAPDCGRGETPSRRGLTLCPPRGSVAAQPRCPLGTVRLAAARPEAAITPTAILDREPNTIRRQLARSFLGVVVVTALVGSVAVLLIAARLSSVNGSLDRAATLERQAGLLREALLEQEDGFRGYELTGDSAFLEPYHDGRSEQGAAQSAIEDESGGDPAILARLKAVQAAADAWHTSWVDQVMQTVAAGRLEEVRQQAATGKGGQLFDAVRGRLDDLDAAVLAVVDRIHADLSAATSLVIGAGVAAVAGMAALLLFLASYLFLVVGRPLARLAATAHDLRLGKSATFEVERDDEIGTLASTLERLHLDLRARYEAAELAAEQATALSDLAETLNLTTDERGLLEAAADTLRSIVAVDAGEIHLLTTTGDLVLKRVGWGRRGPGAGGEGEAASVADDSAIGVAAVAPVAPVPPGALDPKAFPADLCPTVRTGRALQTDAGRPAAALGCPAREGTGSHACIPILAMGRLLGVLHLYRLDPAADFTPNEIQLASQVATETALVLANRRLVSELEAMAMTDPLTRVKNGRFFDAYLEREAAAAERDRRPLGLIMLDVDHFKEFNDSYGHPAGDEALKTLTRTIESTIRTSDTLARYGGEEFIVAVRNADLDETVAVAEKLRAAIAATPVRLDDGRRIPLSASFGVANSALHGYDRRILVLRADQALYRAKQLGRNRVELPFTTSEPPAVRTAAHRKTGTDAGR